MVGQNSRVLVFTKNAGNTFSNMFIDCMENYINITVIQSISYEVMVGVMASFYSNKLIVSDELLQVNYPGCVIGINIAIPKNVDNRVSVSLYKIIYAVPQLCQIRNKFTVFAIYSYIFEQKSAALSFSVQWVGRR